MQASSKDFKKTKTPLLSLDTPLQYVKGVGPKLADIFKQSSLNTVKDFIHILPKSYQNNNLFLKLSEITENQPVIVVANILKKKIIPIRSKHKKMYEIIVGDLTCELSCKFFRIPYKQWFNSLRVGDSIELRGKATLYKNRLEFYHPQIFPYEPASLDNNQNKDQDKILPLYSTIQQVSQYKIRQIMKEIFTSLTLDESELEWLPNWLRKKYQLMPRLQALKRLHQPDPSLFYEYLNFKTEFQKRLIFDEFFELQLYFALKNQGWKLGTASPIPIDKAFIQSVKQKLAFKLTKAQSLVLDQIFHDLSSTQPMHRLIQGDVGCGKTIIALISALVCAKAGYQTAIMVPTEILAHQHYKNACDFLEPFGLNVELLTGKMKTGPKRLVAGVLNSGFCNVCIGTHALIQENIQFHNLAFVIVDEQHRFGAHQRALLKSKARQPHFLVMTATPIPRSLSLILYGDLDISIIDEMPEGRIPITTRRVFPSNRKKVFDFLEQQIKKGRQAYVVYPLVEESEHLDLKNAMDQYVKLTSYYKDLRWGLLTGPMPSCKKQKIMTDFVSGKIQVLVSTTVIEVGVDVPNASMMIIEHAERFGLAQMHQLRGRVGRGSHKSYCVVVLGKQYSKESSERALIMQNTCDGFKISEKDLEIRGPGEFLGSRQSGLATFKLANLVRDARILSLAKRAAFDVISKDAKLMQKDQKKLKQKFQDLSKIIRPG